MGDVSCPCDVLNCGETSHLMKGFLVALILLTVAGCAQNAPQPPKSDPVSQIEDQKKVLSKEDLEEYVRMNKSHWRDWQKQDEMEQMKAHIEAKYQSSEYKNAIENLPDKTKQELARSRAAKELYRNCMKEKIGTDYSDASITCARLLSQAIRKL